MRYKEYGNKQAPIIMFLHGGGVSGWMWRKQIEHFSAQYYCIVVDLPEHGQSKDCSPFTIAGAANQCLALLDEKNNDQPITVVGFSLGAQILLEMLSIRPTFIAYAMVNSALVIPQPQLIKWTKKTMKWVYPLSHIQMFAKLQSKVLYISDDEFGQYFEDSKAITEAALLRILTENMSYELPSNLAQIQTKVLVTVGKKEKRIMVDSYHRLLLSNASFHGEIINHVGHGFSLYAPDQFNRLLSSWISVSYVDFPC